MTSVFMMSNSAFSFPTDWGEVRPALLTPLMLDGVQIGEIWINPKENNIFVDKKELSLILNKILAEKVYNELSNLNSGQNFFTSVELGQLDIKLSFNSNELYLDIYIPLGLRRSGNLDLTYSTDQKQIVVQPSDFSTYLNFDVGKSFENFEQSGETIYNNFNLNYKSHILSAGGYYRSDSPTKKYTREYTRYIYDFVPVHSRLIIGDLDYSTVDLQEQIQGAGLTIQNDFSINPRLLRTNNNRYEIELNRPSLVEIFLNEARIYNSYHPAGLLNLNSLPLVIGQNTIKILFTDSNGRRETLYYNTNYHSNLLPVGLTDYAFNVLSPSSLDEESELQYNTSEKLYSGFFRYGLDSNTTVGLNYQNKSNFSLAGLELSRSLTYALVELYPSISTFEDNQRNSFFLGLQTIPFGKHLEKINARASVRTFEHGFQNIRGEITNVSKRYASSLSYALNAQSSLGFGYEQDERHFDDDQSFGNLEYLHRINGYMNFSIRARKNLSTNDDDSVFFSFNWSEPSRRFSGNHTYQSDTEDFRNQLNLQENFETSNLFVSTSYDSNIESKTQNTRLFSQLETSYGNFRLDHSETGSTRTTNANLRFALAATSSSLNLTPYINNSFVIFESESASKIPIPGQFTQVVTDKNHVSRVNLIPYTENQFEFDMSQLPFGEELEAERVTIKPGFRSGTYYKIKTKKALAISFKILVTNNKYLTGTISNDKDNYQFMTGKNGKAFIPDIKPGDYFLKLDNSDTILKLNIPKASGYIELGDINYEN